MANKLDFTGRRVLVTGGGQGLGLGMVKKFLELGATVIVMTRSQALLENLASVHPSVIGVQVDLCDWVACTKAVESVLPIHHLVNNAAITNPAPSIFDITEQHIDSVMNTNFKVCVHISQIIAKDIMDKKIEDGTIVNISSTSDRVQLTKGTGTFIYSCSKAALNTLTKVLALELQDHGIRVNCVRPNVVDTEILRSLPEEIKEKVVKYSTSKHLHNRLISTEDVADAVAFLSSKMSGMVTGTSLTVDAGYELH